jgi:hypothetical protein
LEGKTFLELVATTVKEKDPLTGNPKDVPALDEEKIANQ